MKIRFNCDSGANIKSTNSSGWLDPLKDLDLEEGEWEELDHKEKQAMAEEWASQYMCIWFDES